MTFKRPLFSHAMRRFFTASFLALTATLPVVAQDQITLKNKDLFIGKVVALKDGLIEFTTPHCASPLKILNKDLVQLNFSDTDTGKLPKNSQVLNLRNGDTFPGHVVSLSETQLGFETWFAGTIEVPRTMVDSVYFGVTPQRTISRGPKDIQDWTQANDGGWTLRNGGMSSSRPSLIGKNLELPENFIFRATIGWAKTPNMRIHLCSDQLKPIDKETNNSYLISINTVGIEVKRVMPKGSPGPASPTLITHLTKLQELGENEVRLELRANRKTRTLQLYLNDVELEQGLDPAEPPSGSHVLFESQSTARRGTLISNLVIQEWDAATQLQRLEPRAADDKDTLSVDDGDRFSGKITGYDATTPSFTVKSPLSPDPIRIPLENCSVMYFASGENAPPAQGQYQLDLRNGGQLTLSGIRLGKEELDATHPWLGELKVNRRIMRSISKGK